MTRPRSISQRINLIGGDGEVKSIAERFPEIFVNNGIEDVASKESFFARPNRACV